jgi:uncharacterized lipoprotein YmbA
MTVSLPRRRVTAGMVMAGLILGGLATALGGCSLMSEPPVNRYIVNPVAMVPVEMPRGARTPLVGIFPVTIPAHADRPEVVTRGPSNAVSVQPTERWAENLSLNLTQALARNVATLLASEQVVFLPSPIDMPVDAEVRLELSQFELDGLGNAVIAGQWTVSSPRSQRDPVSAAVDVHEPVVPDGYEAGVAALSRGLSVVSREIAEAIARNAGPADRRRASRRR